LRRWVSRETTKSSYPDADPGGWSTERLIRELEASYDEPADAATRGSPTWTSVTVEGDEVGKLGAFPACGWDELSNSGTIGDVVDRLRTEDLGDEFPEAIRKVSEFRRTYPEQDFGALVARHLDDWPPILRHLDDWPPILVEGNHRACAAHWASREGKHVELEVHSGSSPAG
jgi:hypothetical protein